MGPMGSRSRQSLSLLPMVPLAAPLVVGLRAGRPWPRRRIPGPISSGGEAVPLLACQALSLVTGHHVARQLTNLGKRR
jgi:hypothetical protein